MSQYNLGTPINPNTTSGTDLATALSSWRDAVHTHHSGTSAPSYAVAGMIWYDTNSSPRPVKIYDGSQWAIIGYHDTTNDVFFPTTQNPKLTFPTSGGSSNAYTLTLSPAMTSYVDQDTITIEANHTSTGAATINVNGLGAKAIRKISGGTDVAIAANDILIAGRYFLNYDSSANAAAGAFILVQPALDLPSLSGTIANTQLPERLQEGGRTITQFNDTALTSGWYICAPSTSNAPDTNGYNLHVLRYSSSYQVQDAYAPNANTHYRRYLDGGVWTSWQRIYDTASEVQSLVDNGLAAVALGAVASQADFNDPSSTGYGPGGVIAGSNIIYAGAQIDNLGIVGDGTDGAALTAGGSSPAGSWRRHHRNNSSGTRGRHGSQFRTA